LSIFKLISDLLAYPFNFYDFRVCDNVYELYQCYKRGERVAVLEGGQLARVGDTIAVAEHMNYFFILRPETGVETGSEAAIKRDFKQTLAAKETSFKIQGLDRYYHIQWDPSTSGIKHYRYVTWGQGGYYAVSPQLWETGRSDFFKEPQPPIILALH
jgi:hypothetical protein